MGRIDRLHPVLTPKKKCAGRKIQKEEAAGVYEENTGEDAVLRLEGKADLGPVDTEVLGVAGFFSLICYSCVLLQNELQVPGWRNFISLIILPAFARLQIKYDATLLHIRYSAPEVYSRFAPDNAAANSGLGVVIFTYGFLASATASFSANPHLICEQTAGICNFIKALPERCCAGTKALSASTYWFKLYVHIPRRLKNLRSLQMLLVPYKPVASGDVIARPSSVTAFKFRKQRNILRRRGRWMMCIAQRFRCIRNRPFFPK